MSREQFLEQVRKAAAAGRAFRVHPEPLPDQVGYVGAGPDPVADCCRELEAVGSFPQVLAGEQEARQALSRLLDEHCAQSALCWQHALLDQLGVRELLAQKNRQCHDHETMAGVPSDQQRERILAADVGISSVDYAVAETGSLVVCSAPGRERMTSLAPPVHIALVGESQIVPDLFDVFERLSQAGLEHLPSNLAFITGPSKTGDIELQLTTGVHGPGQCHVLLVRGV